MISKLKCGDIGTATKYRREKPQNALQYKSKHFRNTYTSVHDFSYICHIPFAVAEHINKTMY